MLRLFLSAFFLLTLASCGEKGPDEIRYPSMGLDLPRQPPNTDLSIRAENKRLVEKCYGRMSVASHRVNRRRYFPDGAHFPKRYSIQKDETPQIRLILKLGMRFENAETEAIQAELMDKVNSCKAPIRELFARYSLNLDLTLENASHPSNQSKEYDYKVVLTEEYNTGPMNTALWSGRNTTLCQDMIHEIGHYLGLFDEYADRRFPDRWVSHERDPYSVMAGSGQFSNVDFYPRHIKSILAPVCPGLE